ncbi:hypothetical protein [Leeuwenhoekiella sp. NPDC079379]|uniref:hypothetical protein n=1 Tax=Leeuwenhoekiella sp. NPDC079379 TaxID=3364122 RepID=UPI0037C93BC5
MMLTEKDKAFVKMWREKRTAKFQFFSGIVLQIVLIAVTYKLVVNYFSGGIFDIEVFLKYGLFGLILGIVVAFFKFRTNEKRYKKLKPGS